MDVYHIWFDLKPGVDDVAFAEDLRAYLEPLRATGRARGFRVTRAKLGLRPSALREWHVMIDFDDLAQLQAAFEGVAARVDPIEQLHHAVNSKVHNALFGLYRDFPDGVRVRGQERF